MNKAIYAVSTIVFTAIIAIVPFNLMACDACSGITNSFSPNQSFLQRSHSVSINTDIRLYDVTLVEGSLPGFAKTFHDEEGSSGPGTDVYYQEQYSSYNITGVYYPIKRLAITAVVPYNHTVLKQEGRVLDNIAGFGDVSLLAQYHIINGPANEADTAKVVHRLTVGAGIKLPTGKFNSVGYDEVVEPYLQPGTGSVDFPFAIQYLLMVKGFGMVPELNAKVNTTNSNGFKFANSINTRLTLLYSKTVKKFNITPVTGLNFDHGGKAKVNGVAYGKDTGGSLLATFWGVDMSLKDFGMNFNYFKPVHQKLNGEQFENQHRFTASIRYIFRSKSKPQTFTNE